MTGNMKMADLVNSAPSLLIIADRLKIRLGFGDRSVEECCIRDGRDSLTFLTLCSIALSAEYKPSEAELAKVRIEDVTEFLRNSHDSYKYCLLPRMEKEIEAVLSGRPESQQKVIKEFFRKFKDELSLHFGMEEEKIFPSLEAIGGKGKAAVKVFRHEHGDIGEKIQDLINLLIKYIPFENRDEKISSVLTFLYWLKDDLILHSRIEDRLILPLIGGDLSPREKEILICVAQGMLNKEIAYKYNLSIFTVMTHRKNITAKTGIKSIAGLTAYAILQGLIDIESIK